MMPGDSQSKMVPIAAEATVGTCRNCSVLHQSLSEYVASFLALKQKITNSEEAIRLQQQLEELQIRLASLEKKSADYESVQAELEEKKCAIRGFEKMAKEMEKLKEENSKTIAQNKMLENRLKDVQEETETQALENVQLKKEKATVENELLQTQVSLKASRAQADQVEKLKEENTKTTSIKNSLEIKVKLLEESVCKQNHEIAQMTRQKTLLERSLHDLQVRMMTMERERNKEYRSTSTQASAPEPPKVDKEKVRMLLENLWACVEPQQQPANLLHFLESTTKHVLPSPENRLHSYPGESDTFLSPNRRVHESQRQSIPSKTTYVQKVIKHQESLQNTNGKRQTDKTRKVKGSSKQLKVEHVSADLDRPEIAMEEIFDLFKPLPPCISPLPPWNKDLEAKTEQNFLKTEDGEMEKHSKPSDVSLQQEKSLPSTTSASSHSPKCSVLSTEEPLDVPMDTTQEMEHVRNENKNIAQNETNGIKTDKRHSAKHYETHHQEDMQTDQLASSSSLSSASTVLHEVPLLSIDNQAPSFSVNPSCSRASSISEAPQCSTPGRVSVEHIQEETEDQLECTAKTDVANASGDTGTEVITPDDGVSLGRSDSTAFSEAASDVQPVTSSTLISSLQSSEVTNTRNEREIRKATRDSCGLGLGHQKAAVFEDNSGSLSEDAHLLEGNSHVAESGISNVSSEQPQARSENDVSIKRLGEKNADKPPTGTVEVSASAPQTDGALTPGLASPHKSPLLIIADADGPLTDQESGNKNDESSSTKDVTMETLKRQMSAERNNDTSHFDTEQTLDIEPMQKSRHHLCQQLRASCLLPTVKLHSLKPQARSEIGNTDVSSKSPSVNNDMPVPNLVEKDVLETATVKDLPQERVASSGKEVNKSCVTPTDSPTPSLGQSIAATNGQNDSEKLCIVVPKKLSPDMTGEGETTAQPHESMHDVCSEMGPPLPSLLTPLSSTPTKKVKAIDPKHAIEKLTFPSPLDTLASPTTPVKTTSSAQQLNSASLNSPVPPNGVPSSPLQFGSATPKHAVPVPGRLPFATNNSSPSSSCPSQENSMRIFDSMYPELSARARTLSILRGNVNLSICSSESGTPPTTTDSQMSGFKSINSVATAFTKTELRGEKRPAVSLPQPKNNKFPKLETSAVIRKPTPSSSSASADDKTSPQALRLEDVKNEMTSQSTEGGKPVKQSGIVDTLEKIENQCFDLLPVIKSHLYVGNLPKKPVLRDEEREAISESCQNSLFTADDMISAILKKLTAEKGLLSANYMQALCRVYTGICRQTTDWEKAHILAYSILTEDFPDSAKLVLFIVATWPTVLSHSSSLCQAIHTVTRLKAPEDVLGCLSAYLGWEKTPPIDIDQLISRTLSEIESGSSLSFTKHSHHGDDLGTEAWEHIFTLYLLCTHKKWMWTYEHLLGKALWPLMNTWMLQPRTQQTPISDATVATVVRLIGRLGSMGLKERNVSSVVTIANIINTFGRHGHAEGVPWEVQLAAVYCISDLSPCNPRQALDALAGWRAETIQSIPPAVTSCINQLSYICRQDKR